MPIELNVAIACASMFLAGCTIIGITCLFKR